MKRQVRFKEEQTTYRFVLAEDDTHIFEINKDTLTFSSDAFYKAFFKGLGKKPDYELLSPTEELKGQSKHVFDTVSAIFKKACDSIDDAWFVTADSDTPTANSNAPEERVN